MSIEATQETEHAALSGWLDRVSELLDQKAAAEAVVKSIKQELEAAEAKAVEFLAMSGLDSAKRGGRSWSLIEKFHVSVLAANRDKVVKAAIAAGLKDAVSVNPSTLRAWLKEQHDRMGDDSAPLGQGTPFAGLVNEYREVRLSHRSVG
jgi:hypothetical protein